MCCCQVAESSGSSVEDVRQEVHSLLDEIEHKMALPAVRTIASILRPVLRKVLTAIYVNSEGINLVSS